MSTWGRRRPGGVELLKPAANPADQTKPAQMQGSEARYGYLLAALLVVVTILNLTVTHGHGAPKHPDYPLLAVGLLPALGVAAATYLWHNRLLTPLLAIVAAFVESLPPVPSSVANLHVVVLFAVIIYAFWLTQRQRKAQSLLGGPRTRARNRGDTAGSAGSAPAARRGGKRSAKDEPEAPAGPAANSRYTPPGVKARARPRTPS